jgi:hypothetical protein
VTLEGREKKYQKGYTCHITAPLALQKSMNGKKVRVETIYLFVGFSPQAPHCEIYSTIYPKT